MNFDDLVKLKPTSTTIKIDGLGDEVEVFLFSREFVDSMDHSKDVSYVAIQALKGADHVPTDEEVKALNSSLPYSQIQDIVTKAMSIRSEVEAGKQ